MLPNHAHEGEEGGDAREAAAPAALPEGPLPSETADPSPGALGRIAAAAARTLMAARRSAAHLLGGQPLFAPLAADSPTAEPAAFPVNGRRGRAAGITAGIPPLQPPQPLLAPAASPPASPAALPALPPALAAPHGLGIAPLTPHPPTGGKNLTTLSAHGGQGGPPEVGRPRWRSHGDFMMTCIGYGVGIGNFGRFPYLCHRYGGGAFLLAHAVCTALAGVPLVLVEFGLGQQLQAGAVRVWHSVDARFAGLGVSAVAVAALCAVYYNVVIAYVIFYSLSSLRPALPWAITPTAPAPAAATPAAAAFERASRYFFDGVLRQSTSISDLRLSATNPLLILAVGAAWLLTHRFCVRGSPAKGGPFVFATAAVPYCGLLALLLRAATLPGAGEGLWRFVALRGSWLALLSPGLWATASAQVLASLGVGFACLMHHASYNDGANDFVRDARVYVWLNYVAAVLGGAVVFAVFGHFSEVTRLPFEAAAGAAGQNLVFIAFPAALSLVPGAHALTALFYLILICAGTSSQFAMVEVVLAALREHGGPRLRAAAGVAVCAAAAGAGAFLATPAGPYFLEAADAAVSVIALPAAIFAQVWGFRRWVRAGRFAAAAATVHRFRGIVAPAVMKHQLTWGLPAFVAFSLICALLSWAFGGGTGGDGEGFGETGWAGKNTPRSKKPLMCPDATCHGNGSCDIHENVCVCFRGFGGADCARPLENPLSYECPNDCSGFGSCDSTSGFCACNAGYKGIACSDIAAPRNERSWSFSAILLAATVAVLLVYPIPKYFLRTNARRKLKQRLRSPSQRRRRPSGSLELGGGAVQVRFMQLPSDDDAPATVVAAAQVEAAASPASSVDPLVASLESSEEASALGDGAVT